MNSKFYRACQFFLAGAAKASCTARETTVPFEYVSVEEAIRRRSSKLQRYGLGRYPEVTFKTANARTLDTRGRIFEASGRRDEAIADFRRALSVGVNDPDVQASGKEALKRLGASE